MSQTNQPICFNCPLKEYRSPSLLEILGQDPEFVAQWQGELKKASDYWHEMHGPLVGFRTVMKMWLESSAIRSEEPKNDFRDSVGSDTNG